MTEKTIRERLASARPAEIPLCCLYLVAAVFEGPPIGTIFVTSNYSLPAKRKARRKK
jgi:ABC-type antimicrobial peptide transport system permease subunit